MHSEIDDIIIKIKELTNDINNKIDGTSFELCPPLLNQRLSLLKALEAQVNSHDNEAVKAQFKEILLWVQAQDVSRKLISQEQRDISLKNINQQLNTNKALAAYKNI